MGYSARYHAASLAAVFLALAIGILLGSQYGGDLLSSTRKDLEKSLTSDLDSARAEVKQLDQRVEWSDDFGQTAFPLLVENRLVGRRIGLIGMGDLPSGVTDAVEAAIEPTGGTLAAVGAIRQPPDLEELSSSLADTPFRRVDRTPHALTRFGRTFGRQMITGGRVLDLSAGAMMSQSSGEFGGLDGLVLYRSADSGLSEADAALSERLDGAVLTGAAGTGARLVGVEALDTTPSGTGFFRDKNLSTVDNVDMASGKVSLVYTLNGAEGSFGVKEGASRLMPELLRPVYGFAPGLREQPRRTG